MFTNRSFYLLIVVCFLVTACAPQVAQTPIPSPSASTPTKMPPLEFKGHTGSIFEVDISPDGKYLATGSEDGTARLWDLATGETIRTFSGHTSAIDGLAFSPDGKTLITGGDQTVRLWDVATGEELQIFSGHTAGVGDVEFSPDGQSIVSSSGDQTARIWDVANGQTLHILTGHSSYLTRVTYSPDGKFVLTSSGDDSARLWDTATGDEVRVFADHSEDVSAISYSPDGQYIATGDAQTVRLWEAVTGQLARKFSGHKAWVSSIEFSADGKFLLSSAGDRTVRLWELSTGETIRVFNNPALVQDVAFSPDVTLIAAGGDDRIARVWSLQTSVSTLPAQDASDTTLHLAIADAPGRPSEPYVLEFIEQVKTLSHGEITIEPIWQAGDDVPAGFEGGVIQHLMQGDMELGLSASRAFDTQGITSFQALQAPFLITNDALSKAVATSDIASRMLDALSSAGIVGLTLWPEDLRHPFSVVPGEQILSPEDLAGLSVRATSSNLTYQMLESFGASPMMGDIDYQAAESGLRQGFSLTGTPTATGNVVFFPKFQVLFANGAAYEKLSEAQRSILREAAIATQRKAIAEHPSEVDAAAAWCADGGTVVMASDEQVAAFEAAAQPVFASLEKDPLNAELIADIRELKAKTEASPGASACAPEAGQTDPSPEIEAQDWSQGAPPAGVWRVELTVDDFARMGVLRSVAEAEWAGTYEFVFEDGKGIHRSEGKTWTLVCPFTTEVIEDFVRLSFV
ncbi:MAG TPA: hypothetical protein VK897_05440, partial [Anaerolineales bacterium]|nr:hypothetical protein [Anaerolineales bacterium]